MNKKAKLATDNEFEMVYEAEVNQIPLEDTISGPALGKTAKSMQQEFALFSGVSKGTIFWDLFTAEDKEALQKKLETLFPDYNLDVTTEISILTDSKLSEKERRKKLNTEWKNAEKHNKRMGEVRQLLLENIWIQRKYYEGDLLASVVFAICTPNIRDDQYNIARAIFETEDRSSCHPLVRIRKCVVENDSENCCMIFIDENGRVYQNWEDYISNNTLPEGILVVPKKGVYSFDADDIVILDCFRTPASKFSHKALQITDTTTSVAGMAAASVPLAALALPVAAPLMIGAGVVGACVGLWSLGRSAVHLFDRSSHEQSINITDREARSSWLGVAGGTLGLGAMGATHGLARYVASGKDVSIIVEGAVNGINIASIAVNGAGVGNGIYELILKSKDDENVTALDLLQISASLLLFTHSIYNFRYASTIVELTRDGKINEFRKELSNKQRKMFNKMVKETMRIKGPEQGKIDIIRALGKIPDKQYFNDIYKINRDLNQKNIRPSFAPDGSVLLNNEVSMDSSTLRQSIQSGEPIVSPHGALSNLSEIPSSYTGNSTSISLPQLPFNSAVVYRITEIVTSVMRNYFVSNECNLMNCLSHLFEKLSDESVSYLVEITQKFVNEYVMDIERRIRRVLPFEQILWDLFEISARLHGPSTTIDTNFLKTNFKILLEELKLFYEKLIKEPTGELIKCKICCGSYRICKID